MNIYLPQISDLKAPPVQEVDPGGGESEEQLAMLSVEGEHPEVHVAHKGGVHLVTQLQRGFLTFIYLILD